MKCFIVFFTLFTLLSCAPKGPKTYYSSFVGKTKSELILAKGNAKTIKVFDKSEAHIYKVREEYFGDNVTFSKNEILIPKRVTITEHIYYINEKGIVYKYQVWNKKHKLN